MGGDGTDPEDATVHDTPRSRKPRELRPDPGVDDRYEILKPLGRGGMGEVVAARDDVIGREVAIKRMHESVADGPMAARFLREARIQATLDHPAIPPVYELGRDREGRPFIVMKRLVGTTMLDILVAQARGDAEALAKYPQQRLLGAFVDVCLAVELAHTRGVIHRDLKPSNIMIGDFGEVYVLDWGVAKVLGESDVSAALAPTPGAGEEATGYGTQIGTVGYMAPEQAVGAGVAELDERVDVYALGCVLFEILACMPFRRAVTVDGERSPARCAPGRNIPPELDQLCVAATEGDRAARVRSARELGERVQRFLDGDRDHVRRRELAAEHLRRALAAVDAGEASSRIVMQEAGRALALDPTSTQAAELVTRLMLEPPRETPSEVLREIETIDDADGRRYSRNAARAYLVYALAIPLHLYLAPGHWGLLLVLIALLAVTAATVYAGVRWPASRRRAAITLAGNGGLLVFLARITSPFLITPVLAVGIGIVAMSSPVFQRLRLIAATAIVMAVAVTAPLVLELAGLAKRTVWMEGDTMNIRGGPIDASPVAIYTVVVGVSVAMIFACASLVASTARRRRQLRELLFVQSWRLRQLVPLARPSALKMATAPA